MNYDSLFHGSLAPKVVGSIVLLVMVIAVRSLLARAAIHHLEQGEPRGHRICAPVRGNHVLNL